VTPLFLHDEPLLEAGNDPHDNPPEPFSTSTTSNWVAKAGGLPPYIQHVAHAMVEKGKDTSKAISMAVGIVRNWSEGKGGVGKPVQAAASKAMAEWEAKKAGSKGKSAAKATAKVAESLDDRLDALAEAMLDLELVTAAIGGDGLVETLSDHTRDAAHEWRAAVRESATMVAEAPAWMIPVAARRPGFKPIRPESSTGKKLGAGSSTYSASKHPRAPKGTAMGGKFISSGATGHEVNAIQRRLGISETGTFGGKTKRRIEKFQKNHGLQVDGVVGAQTIAAMRSNGTNTSVAPGALTKNDRRYLRRYTTRTSGTGATRSSRPRNIVVR
jgi:hypothetical protein